MIISASDECGPLLLEELYELGLREIFFVGVAELPLVLILASSAPRIHLPGGIERDTVEISAGDVDYLLPVEILEVEAMDSLALAAGLVPQTAAPGEEDSLVGERKGVVVPAGYLFDAVLAHGLLQVELAEIADLGGYADLAEQQRPAHVDLPIRVEDRSVGPRRSHALSNASEPTDGCGQISCFIIRYGELSVLVPAPGVDEHRALALNRPGVLILLDEKFAIFLHGNCIFKLLE